MWASFFKQYYSLTLFISAVKRTNDNQSWVLRGKKSKTLCESCLLFQEWAFFWMPNMRTSHVHSLTLSNCLDERKRAGLLAISYAEIEVRVNYVWSETGFWHFQFLISFVFNTSEIQFDLQGMVSVTSIMQLQGVCDYREIDITFGRWEGVCLLLAPLLRYNYPTRVYLTFSAVY